MALSLVTRSENNKVENSAIERDANRALSTGLSSNARFNDLKVLVQLVYLLSPLGEPVRLIQSKDELSEGGPPAASYQPWGVQFII